MQFHTKWWSVIISICNFIPKVFEKLPKVLPNIEIQRLAILKFHDLYRRYLYSKKSFLIQWWHLSIKINLFFVNLRRRRRYIFSQYKKYKKWCSQLVIKHSYVKNIVCRCRSYDAVNVKSMAKKSLTNFVDLEVLFSYQKCIW